MAKSEEVLGKAGDFFDARPYRPRVRGSSGSYSYEYRLFSIS